MLKASARGDAAAWLKALPYNARTRSTQAEHEAKALKIGGVAVYSILRDWVKGQVTAVEIGMMSFEAAFLSHILLPSGMSVIEHVQRSEERRVGKERVSTCRSRWSPYHEKKKTRRPLY